MKIVVGPTQWQATPVSILTGGYLICKFGGIAPASTDEPRCVININYESI